MLEEKLKKLKNVDKMNLYDIQFILLLEYCELYSIEEIENCLDHV